MISEEIEIIEMLKKNGIPESKPPKMKPKAAISHQQSLSDDIFSDFDTLYTQRMLRIEKKNAAHQLLKKKQEEVKPKEQQKPPISTSAPVARTRFLIFKSPTGDQTLMAKDNGYKYRFPASNVGLVKMVMEQNGFVQGGEQALLVWNVGVVSSNVYQTLGPYQKINHFPKSFQITRKDLMLQNLSKMKSMHPKEYNFYPSTYILPNQMSQFINTQKGGVKWYIIKPNNKSQGKGIWLSNDPIQIMNNHKDTVVVSQYIYNPLLINGLKFDIRLYVAITCINPLRIYLYYDGLTRFATTPYTFDLSSKQNVYAHLTNYSLNKFAQNFQANEQQDECKGHKWSLHALREYMSQNNIQIEPLWHKIEDLVIKTILSIENTMFSAMEMGVPFRTNCFQLLGFDVLIDADLKPWLVQVNLSPSLNTDSTLDLKIKGGMLADLFTMVGIVGLDQQFNDNAYMSNNNKRSKLNANEYARLERLILRESEEEDMRSGGWHKIFPRQNASYYKKMFDVERPFNRLLRDQEMKKSKNRKKY